MKKVFILWMFCLLSLSCLDSPELPTTPNLPEKETARVEFKMQMLTNVSDVLPGMEGNFGGWKIGSGLYVDGSHVGEIKNSYILNVSTTAYIIGSSSYQVGTWYKISFKFHDTNIPLEWQEAIGFQLSVEPIAVDENFTIEGDPIDTGYFVGWKVGDWKECLPGSMWIFRIVEGG